MRLRSRENRQIGYPSNRSRDVALVPYWRRICVVATHGRPELPRLGAGQFIERSVHEAINTCTEIAMPTYIYNGYGPASNGAARGPRGDVVRLSASPDNVYMLASLSPFEREEIAFKQLADQSGIGHVLGTPEYAQLEKEDRRAALTYRNDLIEQVVASRPADEVFDRAQALGLAWSPIRRPEDNLTTDTSPPAAAFTTIQSSRIGRDLSYPQTVATDGRQPHMRYTRRAPRLGEHTTGPPHRPRPLPRLSPESRIAYATYVVIREDGITWARKIFRTFRGNS